MGWMLSNRNLRYVINDLVNLKRLKMGKNASGSSDVTSFQCGNVLFDGRHTKCGFYTLNMAILREGFNKC